MAKLDKFNLDFSTEEGNIIGEEEEKPVSALGQLGLSGVAEEEGTFPEFEEAQLFTQIGRTAEAGDTAEANLIQDPMDSFTQLRKAHRQSNWEQSRNWFIQSVLGEIVGGTISGFGALGELGANIITESSGEDADFNNALIRLGEDLMKYTKEEFPIHRERPNKAFDISDFGWWMENGVSIASTLGLLIPAAGTTRGISMVAKGISALGKGTKGMRGLSMLSKAASKVDDVGDVTKYFGKLGTTAFTMRNAENYRESLQLFEEEYDKTLTHINSQVYDAEGNFLPEKFEALKKEFNINQAFKEEVEGGTFGKMKYAMSGVKPEQRKFETPEEVARFIAAKAGWRAYKINSANIIFDVIQLLPAFMPKGTRLFSPGKLKTAQAELTGIERTVADKFLTAVNPITGSFARQFTEGIEEAVNFIGQEEGRYYADKLMGKDFKPVGERLKNYMSDAHLYESAFWGVLGGMAFEGATRGYRNIKNKGENNIDKRLEEVADRKTKFEMAINQLKMIAENYTDKNGNLTKDGQVLFDTTKKQLGYQVGIRASHVGNVDLVLEHIRSEQFKNQIKESGITSPEAVDQTVKDIVNTVLKSEQVYKKYDSFFRFKENSARAKQILTGNAIEKDLQILATHDRIAELQAEISDLKLTDPLINKTDDLQKASIENAIRLQALREFQKDLAILNDVAALDPAIQNQLGNINTLKTSIAEDIANLENLVETEPSLNGLNKEILKKTKDLVMAEKLLGIKSDELANTLSPEAAEETETHINNITDILNKGSKDTVKDDISIILEDTNRTLDEKIETLREEKDKLTIKDKQIGLEKAYNDAIQALELQKERNDLDAGIVLPEEESIETDKKKDYDNKDQEAIDTIVNALNLRDTVDNRIELLEEIIPLLKQDELTQAADFAQARLDYYLKERNKRTEEEGIVIESELPRRAEAQRRPDRRDADFIGTRENSANLFIPLVKEEITYEEGIYKLTDEQLEIFNALFSEDTSIDTNVVLKVDTEAKDIKTGELIKWKNKSDIPIAIYTHRGIKIGYLNTIKPVEDELRLAKEATKLDSKAAILKWQMSYKDTEYAERANRFANWRKEELDPDNFLDTRPIADWVTIVEGNLKATKKLRRQINKKDSFVTKIKRKTSGSMAEIQATEDDSRHVPVQQSFGMNTPFLVVDTKQAAGKSDNYQVLTSIDGSGTRHIRKDETSNYTNLDFVYDLGVIYTLVETAARDIDGTRVLIPTPLIRRNLNKEEVKFAMNNLMQLAKRVRETNLKDDEVKRLKVLLNKVIYVNKELNAQHISVKVHENKIEIGTYTIHFKPTDQAIAKGAAEDAFVLTRKNKKGEALEVIEGKKYVLSTEFAEFDEALKKILGNRLRNVEYAEMQKADTYEDPVTGKTYKTYKESVLEQNVLYTDVARVEDSKGNKVSNVLPGGMANLVIGIGDKVVTKDKVREKQPVLPEDLQKIVSERTSINEIFDTLGINRESLAFNPIFKVMEQLGIPIKIIPGTANSISKYRYARVKETGELINEEVIIALEQILGSDMNYFKSIGIEGADEMLAMSLAHEGLHGILKRAKNYPKLLEDLEAFRATLNQKDAVQKEALKQSGLNPKIYNYIKRASAEEVVTYAFTHPAFAKFLSLIPDETVENESKSFWGKLKDIILDFVENTLGVTTKLDKLNEILDKHFDEGTFESVHSEPKDDVDLDNLINPDDFIIGEEGLEIEKEEFSRTDRVKAINLSMAYLLSILDNYPTITVAELKENPELNPKKRLIDKLKRIKQNEIDTQNRQVYIEFFDKTLKGMEGDLWTDVLSKLSKTFPSITFSEEFDLDKVDQLEKRWDDTKMFEINSKERVSDKVKRTIFTIFGDFERVYPYIARNMAGAVNPNDMLIRMQIMERHDHRFSRLARALSSDNNLLSAWYSQMQTNALDKLRLNIFNVEDVFDFEAILSNKRSKAEIVIADTWISQAKTIRDDKNQLPKIEKAYNTLAKKLSKLRSTYKATEENREEAGKLISEMYELLGINISPKIIETELAFQTKDAIDKDIIGEHSVYIVRNLPKEDEEKGTPNPIKTEIKILDDIFGNTLNTLYENRNEEFDEYGMINRLADVVKLYQYDIIDNSSMSVDGALINNLALPNFLSNFYRLINNPSRMADGVLLTTLKNYAKDPSMKYSNWLWNTSKNKSEPNGMLNMTVKDGERIKNIEAATLNKEYLKDFRLLHLDGALDTVKNLGINYGNLHGDDWQALKIALFLNSKGKEGVGIFSSVIPSDSGNIYFFQHQKIPLKFLELTGYKLDANSVLFNAVNMVVKQEIERMKQAKELLYEVDENGNLTVKEDLDYSLLQANFHYKKTDKNNIPILLKDGKATGRVFEFHTVTNLNKVKLLRANGVIIDQVEAQEIDDIIEVKTQDFLENLVRKEVKESENLREMFQGKGTFNNIIAEFAINEFLSIAEQQNFFVGTTAEYKNAEDTNKRAKEIQAPGLPLSMIHSGMTFNVATLKDIHGRSSVFENLANSVVDHVRKEKGHRANARFEIKNLYKSTKNMSPLERDVYKVINSYLDINRTDAQGYMSWERYKNIIKDLGRYEQYESLINKVERREELNMADMKKLLEITKGYYYGRTFNAATNRMESHQLKYSTVPLIPQLVNNTDLAKLANFMDNKGVDEIVFESAEKVGINIVNTVHDIDGNIIDEALENVQYKVFYNEYWRLQLDVPTHLKDAVNKIGVQISKLIFSNIDKSATYILDGKSISGKELIAEYHKILVENIKEDAYNLIKRFGGRVEGHTVILDDNTKIRELLIDELERRGLADNMKHGLEFIEGTTTFQLPLFLSAISAKYESVLTSLFTENIVNQKLPGGTAVLMSDVFTSKTNTLVSSLEQTDKEIKDIDWIERIATLPNPEKYRLKTIRLEDTEEGVKVFKAEILLPAWTKKFFKNGKKLSIDVLPEDVREVIGYRIPTDAKHSIAIMEVVGFLPDESGGTIVAPSDFTVQMGSDFDIDELFMIWNNVQVTKDAVEKIKYKTDENSSEKSRYISWVSANLAKPIKEKVTVEEAQIKARKEDLMPYDEFKELSLAKQNSRAARENRIFDIYKSILTNPAHIKEILTPAEFEDLKTARDEVNNIRNIDANTINPTTGRGQTFFRNIAIQGIALKGLASNFNNFLSTAQLLEMYLNPTNGFKIKYTVQEGFNIKELKERYKNDIVKKGNDYVIINHYKLGWNTISNFQNVLGEVTTEYASQSLTNILDIVKHNLPDNINTYTFGAFQSIIMTGGTYRFGTIMMNQPIIRETSKVYFGSRGMFGRKINPVTKVRQETLDKLYKLLPTVKWIDEMIDDKGAITFGWEKTKEHFNIKDKTFSAEELKLELEKEQDFKKMTQNEKIEYYKNQLLILEHFDNLLKNGRTISDGINVFNTDNSNKIGAGPSMSKTHMFLYNLNKLKDNKLLIDKIPAVEKVFPNVRTVTGDTMFSNSFGKESVYPIFETQYNFANRLSTELLSPYFINQTVSYRHAVLMVADKLGIPYNEEIDKQVSKFITSTELNDFNFFNIDKDEKKRILGIDETVVTKKTITKTIYRTLSAANKLKYIQSQYSELMNPQLEHILSHLIPKLEQDEIMRRNGIHGIDFLNPQSNVVKDDNLTDSFYELLTSQDEFLSLLAKDLVVYDFLTTGYNFGARSYAKVIPTKWLIEQGLGTFLYQKQTLARQGLLTFNLDNFVRHNHTNKKLVPSIGMKEGIASKKYSFIPVGDSLMIHNSILENLYEIGEYLKVYYFNDQGKSGEELYKVSQVNEHTTIYSPIGKLDRFFLYETGDESLFEKNNTGKTQEQLLAEVEENRDETQKPEIKGDIESKGVPTRYTPEIVKELEPNQVFVFGSNAEGRHGKGAALTAKQKFGAIQGQAEGLQGQSYAIITKKDWRKVKSSTLLEIKEGIEKLLKDAQEMPDKEFLVTKIGTALAGYTVDEIKGIFEEVKSEIPNNVILPKEFEVRDSGLEFGEDGIMLESEMDKKYKTVHPDGTRKRYTTKNYTTVIKRSQLINEILKDTPYSAKVVQIHGEKGDTRLYYALKISRSDSDIHNHSLLKGLNMSSELIQNALRMLKSSVIKDLPETQALLIALGSKQNPFIEEAAERWNFIKNRIIREIATNKTRTPEYIKKALQDELYTHYVTIQEQGMAIEKKHKKNKKEREKWTEVETFVKEETKYLKRKIEEFSKQTGAEEYTKKLENLLNQLDSNELLSSLISTYHYKEETMDNLEKRLIKYNGIIHKDMTDEERRSLRDALIHTQDFINSFTRIGKLKTLERKAKRKELLPSDKKILEQLEKFKKLESRISDLQELQNEIRREYLSYLKDYTTNPEILNGALEFFGIHWDETKTQALLDALADTNNPLIANAHKAWVVKLHEKEKEVQKLSRAFNKRLKKFKDDGGNLEDLYDKETGKFITKFDDKYLDTIRNYNRQLTSLERAGKSDTKEYYNLLRDYNKWRRENLELEYVDEIYEYYDSIGVEAQMALDELRAEESKLLDRYRTLKDENGKTLPIFDMAALTEKEREQLADIKSRRSFLSSMYDNEGNKKKGLALSIALELEARKDKGEKYFETINYSYRKAEHEAEQKGKRFHKKWLEMNTKLEYTQEFWRQFNEIMSILGKNQSLLNLELRNLLRPYKDKNGIIDGSSMPQKAIERAYEIEVELEIDREAKMTESKGTFNPQIAWAIEKFKELVEFVPTDYYKATKRKMKKELSKKEYEVWYDANHVFDRENNLVPIRAWTKMVPKDSSHIKKSPTDNWSKRQVKDTYRNPKHNPEENNGYALPKEEKWLNSEWTKRDKNTQEFIIYLSELLNKTLSHYKGTMISRGFLPAVELPDSQIGELKRMIGLRKERKRNPEQITDEDNNIIHQVPLQYINFLAKADDLIAIPERKRKESTIKYEERAIEEINTMTGKEFDSLQAVIEYNKNIREKQIKLHAESLDFDIATTIPLFLEKALTHKYKKDIEHELLLVREELLRSEFIKRTGWGDIALNKFGIQEGESGEQLPEIQTIDGKKSNILQHYDDWLRMIFYEEYELDEGIMTDMARVLQNYTSLKGIGFNVFSGINNLVYGRIQTMIEAASGQFFSADDYKKANSMYFSATTSYVGDTLKSNENGNKSTTIQNALIKEFSIIKSQNEIAGEDGGREISKFNLAMYFSNAAYLMQNVGEHQMQNITLFAMLKSHRIVNGKIMNFNDFLQDKKHKIPNITKTNKSQAEYNKLKEEARKLIRENKKITDNARIEFEKYETVEKQYELVDGYAVLKKGAEVSDKEIALFTDRVIRVNHKLHGIYNKEDKGTINNIWIGRLLLQFRNWARPGWNKRFGSRGGLKTLVDLAMGKNIKEGTTFWNEGRGEYDKGMYISTWEFITTPIRGVVQDASEEEKNAWNMIAAIARDYGQFFANADIHWHTLSDQDKANVKRSALELSYLFAAWALLNALRSMGEDDEELKENFAYNIALYQLDRLRMELVTYSPIYGWMNEGTKLLASPTATWSTINSTYKFLYYSTLYPFMNEEERVFRGGMYYGQTKAVVYGERMIPLWNQIQRLKYINKSNKYYKLF